MRVNLVSGGWKRNAPWATEIAFRKGLERCGVYTHAVNSEDPDSHLNTLADATIVFKDSARNRPDLIQEIKSIRGPAVCYQPDDMRFEHVRADMVLAREYCQYASPFEHGSVDIALELGYLNARRIMLPVDDEIYRYSEFPRVLDACFIGNISGDACHNSRRRMVEIVQGMPGLKVVSCSLFNISQVVRTYNMSKVVLHHATDVGQPFGSGYGFQSRHFEAGFSGACVLSNYVDNESHIPGLVYFRDEEELKQQLTYLLENDRWRQYGQTYLKTLQSYYRPENAAEEMLKFIRECM